MSVFRSSFALVMVFCCSLSAEGQSLGRWHVPGTIAQYFGHGFGAGHHAPIVRSPWVRPPYVPRVVVDNSYHHGAYHHGAINQRHSSPYSRRHAHYGTQFAPPAFHAPSYYAPAMSHQPMLHQPMSHHPVVQYPMSRPTPMNQHYAQPAMPQTAPTAPSGDIFAPPPKPKVPVEQQQAIREQVEAEMLEKAPEPPVKPLELGPLPSQPEQSTQPASDDMDLLDGMEDNVTQPSMPMTDPMPTTDPTPTTNPTTVPGNEDQASYGF